MKDIDKILEDVQEGRIEALESYAELKLYAKEIADAIKEVEPFALDEAQKQDDKKFTFKGYLFEFRNGTPRYNYKNIESWNKKQAELKEIEKTAKAALQAANKNLLTATEDGEEVQLPEVTYAKDSLSVRLLS